MDDLASRNIDHLINLGDILYGPIAPRATYDLLQQYPFITISGNQDRQIWEAGPEEIAENPTLAFILDDLGSEPLEWMKSLPFDYSLTEDVYLCHGTPENDLIYLLEDVSRGFPLLRSEQEIEALLAGCSARLILCGHTHIPRAVVTQRGQQIVNPGSVGLQAYTDDLPQLHSMENFSPMASYAVIDIDGEHCVIDHIRVDYDVQAAVAQAEKRGRTDWAHFLNTGRKR